jgi:hypothetical protein
MTITSIAIEGLFLDADDSPSSGTICLTPNSSFWNGDETVPMAPICGLLDPSGRIINQAQRALAVAATTDTLTYPAGVSYTITVKLDGQPMFEFSVPICHLGGACYPPFPNGKPVDVAATVSSTSPVAQLVNLVASTTMVGATVTGNQISGGTTILSVDEDANTVTMSADALGTGVDGAFEISGGCIAFQALRAAAL